MKKILLLNPPSCPPVSRDYYCGHMTKGRYYWPQLDLLILSGYFSDGFQVSVLDATVEGLTPEQTLARVDAASPDVVISVVAAISWRADMDVLARIKERRQATIAVSGDYARACPADVLRANPAVDAVVLDFTDSDILPFVRGERSSGLRNVVTRDGPPVVENAKTFRLPMPRHDRFDLKRYHLPTIRRHPFTMLMTDYGCPFSCRFCFMERVEYKRREIDNVAEELQVIRSLGVRELLIADQSFGSVKEHALEVCRILRESGGRFSWVCDMRVDAASEDLLRTMKEAGCHTVMFGVETPNEAVLARQRKGIVPEQMRRAFSLAKKARLSTLAHFILGLPGENAASLQRLIDFSIELGPDIASFNVAAPAWNTSLRDEVTEHDWMIDNGVEIADGQSYPTWESPELTRDEVWRMRQRALRRFYLRPSYILRQLGSVRTSYQLQTLLREGWHMVRNVAFPSHRESA